MIDVDPSGVGDTNLFTFPAGSPVLFTDPGTNHVALSDPFAVGHNFNQKGVLLVNGGSSISNTTLGDPYTFSTGIVIGGGEAAPPENIPGIGILTLIGNNSSLTSNTNLAIGGFGNGTLNVWDGATATSNVSWIGYEPNSTGLARVWNVGSAWEPKELAVGVEGEGTIDVAGGGRVGASTFVFWQHQLHRFRSIGTATVDGAGSTFYGGELFRIGQGGNGTLNITDGGTVVHNFNVGFDAYTPANGLVLGNNSGSTGTINVSGSNSSLTSNKNLSVGLHGSGTLDVQAGGTVISNVSWLGHSLGSTGLATISGLESRWEPDELAIGVEGSGTMNITNGGPSRLHFACWQQHQLHRFRLKRHGYGRWSWLDVAGGETFVVGQAGNGTLNVEGGGTVIHNFNPAADAYSPGTGLVIGHNGGSTGTITVDWSQLDVNKQ